jgi:hypothetical protein
MKGGRHVAQEENYDPEDYNDDLQGPNLEIPGKYLAWRSLPAAIKRGFPQITKDLPLGNLNEKDLELIRIYFDLLMQNEALVTDKIVSRADIKMASDFLESQIAMITNSSVGFEGFGRKLDGTMIQLKEVQKSELKKDRRYLGRRQ